MLRYQNNYIFYCTDSKYFIPNILYFQRDNFYINLLVCIYINFDVYLTIYLTISHSAIILFLKKNDLYK